MYQNSLLDTSLMAVLLVLLLHFALAATDLANTEDNARSMDEDPIFIDFFRP